MDKRNLSAPVRANTVQSAAQILGLSIYLWLFKFRSASPNESLPPFQIHSFSRALHLCIGTSHYQPGHEVPSALSLREGAKRIGRKHN